MSFVRRAMLEPAAEDIVRYMDERHGVAVDINDVMELMSYNIGGLIRDIEDGVSFPEEI